MAVLFLLGTFLFAQPVAAGPAATGRWAGSSAQLASILLPPEQAADAVSHVVARDPHLPAGPIDEIIFLGRARQSKGGLCSRNSYRVSGIRERADGSIEATSRSVSPTVRLGKCEGVFAHLNAASLDEGKRVLRWAQWAVEAAKSPSPLPFAVRCSDQISSDEDRCMAGPRAVLAALPLDRVAIIERRFPGPHRWNISAGETAPANGYWDVDLNATPGGASVVLAWKPVAVF